MNKEQLLAELKKCAGINDTEAAHIYADDALLNFINDEEIKEAYANVEKWYA